MKTFIERRRAIRVNTDIFVEEIDQAHAQCFPLANLSKDGMYFYTSGLTKHLGRFATLEFEIPGQHNKLRVRGEVVRRKVEKDNDYVGVGFRFLDLSMPNKDIIKQYVTTSVFSFAHA